VPANRLDLSHGNAGVILPAYKEHWNKAWTKSGAISRRKSKANNWMYWLGTAEDKTDQMGFPLEGFGSLDGSNSNARSAATSGQV